MQVSTRRALAVSALAASVLAGAVLAGQAWWLGRPGRWLVAAEEALRSGDPEGALEWLALPERVPVTRDRALLLHARVALELKRISEAAKVLGGVDPRGPMAIDLGYWKGRTLSEAGQSLRATAWYRWVLERRPNDRETLRRLAAAAYDLGDHPTAVTSLRAVTRLDPGDARAWRSLALLYKEDVEHELAAAAYAEALGVDPDQPAARLERAGSLVQLGRYDEAERELAACRGRVSEADRADLLAQCQRARGDEGAYQATVDAGLSVAPDHPGLLGQRARIDLAEGRPDAALARLDRAVTADPYDSQRVYQRGTVLRLLGRPADAEREFARAAELKRTLAEMSALNGEAARAPSDPDVRCRIGWLCAKLGKTDLAASWYRAALACDTNHPGARLALRALGAR